VAGQRVFTTLLQDQISRSDSLNGTAGVLAGLGGVVTTLAGVVPKPSHYKLGLAGISAAGLSVVLAKVGLLMSHPGREPVQLDSLLDRILHTGDTTPTEGVLLYADVAAAKRNDRRLKVKGFSVTLSAMSFASLKGLPSRWLRVS
jgi:hypothetical protein